MQLVDLYENDCIFDKFDACLSPDGKAIATGTYSNNFKVLSREGAPESCLEASRDPHRKRLQTPTPVKVRLQPPRYLACLAGPLGTWLLVRPLRLLWRSLLRHLLCSLLIRTTSDPLAHPQAHK